MYRRNSRNSRADQQRPVYKPAGAGQVEGFQVEGNALYNYNNNNNTNNYNNNWNALYNFTKFSM